MTDDKRIANWNGKLTIFFKMYEDERIEIWMAQGSDKVFYKHK